MSAQAVQQTPWPVIRTITRADVTAALMAGLGDIARAPTYSLFFGLVFSVIGIAITYMLAVVGSSYWALPLAAAFPLIGPFAAVGLYEVSRRLEAGEPLSWGAVLGAVVREGRFQLPSYAFVTLFVLLVWVYLAHLIFALSFGLKPLTNVMSSAEILLSPEGIAMLIGGTIVGGAIAILLFCISVIAVPMLLDRDIDVVSAMVASVQAVIRNTGPMLFWGVIIVLACVLAMLPLFLGMILVFPALGHTSWHLFRRTVEPV